MKKIIKYLGVNLPKKTKYLYTENYKIPMKEIKDDTNRWRDIPWFWIERINIVKMIITPIVMSHPQRVGQIERVALAYKHYHV